MVEMEEYAEELNEAIYQKEGNKRKALFGNSDIFTINWDFFDLNAGRTLSATPVIQNGKFKNSKINFVFPPSSNLLQFTAKASIKDKYGMSNAEPLEFTFYNKEIRLSDPKTEIKNWLNPYLVCTREGRLYLDERSLGKAKGKSGLS